MRGKVWKYGDHIDTDVIIPGRYLRTFNPQDLADHVLEGERPDFTKNVKKGDIKMLKYLITQKGRAHYELCLNFLFTYISILLHLP